MVSSTPRLLFTPGKDPVPIINEAGWSPGPIWTGAENLAPTGIRFPDRPTRSQSLYRLSFMDVVQLLNFKAPCIQYVGQAHFHSPRKAFNILIYQIYLIIFFEACCTIANYSTIKFRVFRKTVHKIFTFDLNVVLNFKCPAPGPKG